MVIPTKMVPAGEAVPCDAQGTVIEYEDGDTPCKHCLKNGTRTLVKYKLSTLPNPFTRTFETEAVTCESVI